MMTNAQVALQAAATFHAGSKYKPWSDVINTAANFTYWLDSKDAADRKAAGCSCTEETLAHGRKQIYPDRSCPVHGEGATS